MKPKWTLSAKILFLAGIPIILQLILFISLTAIENASTSKLAILQKAIAISSEETSASLSTVDMFLKTDLEREAYIASPDFEEHQRAGEEKLKHLQQLLQDRPEEAQKMKTLLEIGTSLHKRVDQAKEDFMSGNVPEQGLSKNYYELTRDFQVAIQKIVSLMISARQSALSNLPTVDLQKLDQQYMLVLQAGLLSETVLVGAALIWLSRDLGSRFKIMTDNAYRLASRRQLAPHIGGQDELSMIDSAFHLLERRLSDFDVNEKTLAEHSRAFICALNDKFAFVNVDAASTMLFGFAPDELLSMKLANILQPADASHHLHLFEQSKNGQFQMFNCNCTNKTGAFLETEWTVRWSAKDELYFCTVHDITERAQAERQRRELISLVSEELERPLQRILVTLRALPSARHSQLTERGARLQVRAVSAATQMSILIKDLIDVDNLESGNIDLNLARHSAMQIVEQSIHMVAGLSAASNITVQSKGEDYQLDVDSDRIKQILVNLISNALKFSPRGSTVTVEISHSSDWAEFKVTDRGRGIPEELLPVVFERFKQVKVSDAREKGGSGLGLAICKTLVALHNGKISVASKVDQGTSFTIHLPINSRRLAAG